MMMMISRRKTWLLLVPLFLLTGMWLTNWRRLHPPPTELDEQVRALLLSADRVEVEVDNVEIPGGRISTFVTCLSTNEIQSVVRSINLTQEGLPDTWGSGYVPCLYFNFSKRGQPLGALSISYSSLGYNYFFDARKQSRIRRGLHPTTLIRLRELVAQHPEIMQALVKEGAEQQRLAPKAFQPNES